MGTRGIAALAVTFGLLAAVPGASATTGPAGDTWTPHVSDDAVASIEGGRSAPKAMITLTPAHGGRVLRSDRPDELPFTIEPLMPGERLTATWTRLGPRARLTVLVADPLRRARDVSIPLRPADRRTTVAVGVDGALTIARGAEAVVSPEPPLGPGDPGGPAVPWTATTPQAAVRGALRTLRLDDPLPDLARYCAALEPADAAGRGAVETDDDWAVSPIPSTCALGVYTEMYENDNSTPGPTTGTIVSTRRVSDREAVVTVRLRHRYASTPDVLRRTVTVLVVRERADEPWRISDEQALVAPWDPAAPGDFPGRDTLKRLRELRRMRASFARESRVEEEKRRPAMAAATVAVAPAAAACPAGVGSTTDDAIGDVRALDAAPRDPALVTADVRSARLDWRAAGACLTVRFARPPGARFHVMLATRPGIGVELRVVDGRAALVGGLIGTSMDPLPGVSASLTGDTLLVRLPPKAVRKPSPAIHWWLRVLGPHPHTLDGLLDKVEDPRSRTLADRSR